MDVAQATPLETQLAQIASGVSPTTMATCRGLLPLAQVSEGKAHKCTFLLVPVQGQSLVARPF